MYKPGMNLSEYLERYSYFPKLTDFIFGELAYKVRCRGFLEKEDFILIWLWKTQLWQIDKEKGDFRHRNPEDHFESDEQKVNKITGQIFAIDHSSRDDVAKLIGVLCKLSGVGAKVAIAILSVVFPDRYGVVDVHVLSALGFEDSRRAIHSAQYPEHVRTEGEMYDYWWAERIFQIREIAKEQARITGRYWTPRMVDMALWVLNRETRRR